MCVHDLHDHAPVFYTTDVHARTHVCVCVWGGVPSKSVCFASVCVCANFKTLCCSNCRTLRCAAVCFAHSHGVRVVRSAPFTEAQQASIHNATVRTAWVQLWLGRVQAQGIDGLTLAS